MNIRFLLLGLVPLLAACSSGDSGDHPVVPEQNSGPDLYINKLEGEAQGTTYHISFLDTFENNITAQVDSILLQFDYALSNWNPNSNITQLNACDSSACHFVDTFGYFTRVYEISSEVYSLSDGSFDPTVLPLVNAWGFGFKNKEEMTEERVLALLQNVSFSDENISLSEMGETMLLKKKSGAQLDFNAIAQGYSVDVICEYLKEQGIKDYVVEIGGELRVKGQNAYGTDWRVQVDKPVESDAWTRERQAVIGIPSGKSLATSGNYRKFREEDGVKLSHTIDPRTGYPVNHSLLSATILADNCAMADAMATVFMVMGVEKTKSFLSTHKELNLEVYLVFSDENGNMKTFASEGMKPILTEVEEEN